MIPANEFTIRILKDVEKYDRRLKKISKNLENVSTDEIHELFNKIIEKNLSMNRLFITILLKAITDLGTPTSLNTFIYKKIMFTITRTPYSYIVTTKNKKGIIK